MQHLFRLHSSLRGRRKEGEEVRRERREGRVKVKGQEFDRGVLEVTGIVLVFVSGIEDFSHINCTLHTFHTSSLSLCSSPHTLQVLNLIKMCCMCYLNIFQENVTLQSLSL